MSKQLTSNQFKPTTINGNLYLENDKSTLLEPNIVFTYNDVVYNITPAILQSLFTSSNTALQALTTTNTNNITTNTNNITNNTSQITNIKIITDPFTYLPTSNLPTGLYLKSSNSNTYIVNNVEIALISTLYIGCPSISFSETFQGLSSTVFSYLSSITGNVQDSLNSFSNLVSNSGLQYNSDNKNTYIVNSVGIALISNSLYIGCPSISFTGVLQGLTTTVVSYLSTITPNIQNALNGIQIIAYNSGWISIVTNTITTITHNLNHNYTNNIVRFQILFTPTSSSTNIIVLSPYSTYTSSGGNATFSYGAIVQTDANNLYIKQV